MNQLIESEWNARDTFPEPGNIITYDDNNGTRHIALVLAQEHWDNQNIAVVDIEKGKGHKSLISRASLYSGRLPYRYFSGEIQVFATEIEGVVRCK